MYIYNNPNIETFVCGKAFYRLHADGLDWYGVIRVIVLGNT